MKFLVVKNVSKKWLCWIYYPRVAPENMGNHRRPEEQWQGETLFLTWCIEFLRDKWVDPFWLIKYEICSQEGEGSKHNLLPGDVCGQWKIQGISGAGAGAS